MGCPVFYACNDKQLILGLITGDKKEALSCLGSSFEELTAGTSDGAVEKHLPAVRVEDGEVTVKIGSVLHPMTQEHSIDWIYLETREGSQLKKLSPNQEPIAKFALSTGDEPIAAYAYCNLHGFWQTKL